MSQDIEQATHLLDWLPGGYDHCKYGSRDWCESYLNNAASVIRAQDALITTLRAERDAALEAEDEAKDSFWAIYPDWVELKGHGISTEAARTALVDRANTAEALVQSMREALEPFAKYMQDGGDLDNKGSPLPDEQGVGWVYLTQADFRRARAALSALAQVKS